MLRRTQQAGKKKKKRLLSALNCKHTNTHLHARTHSPPCLSWPLLLLYVWHAAWKLRLRGIYQGNSSLYLCAAPSFFAHLPPLPNISAPTHSSPRCDSTETPPEVLAQAFSPRRRLRCPPLTLPLPPLSRQAAEKATPVLADDQFLISRRVVSERAASQKDVGKRELQGGWRQEEGGGGVTEDEERR